MSVLDVEMRSARERERDLQRKSYFIGLEMQRKLRIARVVSNDIDIEKRRAEIETRVLLRFKREVRMSTTPRAVNLMPSQGVAGTLTSFERVISRKRHLAESKSAPQGLGGPSLDASSTPRSRSSLTLSKKAAEEKLRNEPSSVSREPKEQFNMPNEELRSYAESDITSSGWMDNSLVPEKANSSEPMAESSACDPITEAKAALSMTKADDSLLPEEASSSHSEAESRASISAAAVNVDSTERGGDDDNASPPVVVDDETSERAADPIAEAEAALSTTKADDSLLLEEASSSEPVALSRASISAAAVNVDSTERGGDDDNASAPVVVGDETSERVADPITEAEAALSTTKADDSLLPEEASSSEPVALSRASISAAEVNVDSTERGGDDDNASPPVVVDDETSERAADPITEAEAALSTTKADDSLLPEEASSSEPEALSRASISAAAVSVDSTERGGDDDNASPPVVVDDETSERAADPVTEVEAALSTTKADYSLLPEEASSSHSEAESRASISAAAVEVYSRESGVDADEAIESAKTTTPPPVVDDETLDLVADAPIAALREASGEQSRESAAVAIQRVARVRSARMQASREGGGSGEAGGAVGAEGESAPAGASETVPAKETVLEAEDDGAFESADLIVAAEAEAALSTTKADDSLVPEEASSSHSEAESRASTSAAEVSAISLSSAALSIAHVSDLSPRSEVVQVLDGLIVCMENSKPGSGKSPPVGNGFALAKMRKTSLD